MRRFNYARPTLFHSANACVTAKREMGIPSANKFNFLMRFVDFSVCAYLVGFAGLMFWAYKQEESEKRSFEDIWDPTKYKYVERPPVNGVSDDVAWYVRINAEKPTIGEEMRRYFEYRASQPRPPQGLYTASGKFIPSEKLPEYLAEKNINRPK